MKTRWLFFLLALGLAGWGWGGTAPAPFTGGLFDLYAQNRARNLPNYITEDFLLLSYNLIERRATAELEDREIAPRLGALIEGLARTLQAMPDNDPVTTANRQYAALLDALWRDGGQSLDGPAAEELRLILAAGGVTASPLWGYASDYSQFKPRGRYADTPELQRYFRALRYANTVLFAVTPTQATGVTPAGAERMARQAGQLLDILAKAPELGQARAELLGRLTARFGSGDDLGDEDLSQVLAAKPESLSQALLERARAAKRQPRILGGLVNIDRLEKGLTPADALTGWRLIPAVHTPESAAFQQLVYPGAQAWLPPKPERAQQPFGLGQVGGRPVKAYPLALELMALLGGAEAAKQLEEGGETGFIGYQAASSQAKTRLGEAQGLQKARLAFLAQSLNPPSPAKARERQQALLAFWTGIRYGEQLYVKQSYTPVGKGIRMQEPRAGALLEPSTDLYRGLAALAEEQAKRDGGKRWQEFAGLLRQLIGLSARIEKGGKPTAEDEERLNGLDETLLALAGGKDRPIVVDIHTHAEEGMVVEEGVGFARPVDQGPARGARLVHREFKQPLAQRLDDAAWAAQLAAETVR